MSKCALFSSYSDCTTVLDLTELTWTLFKHMSGKSQSNRPALWKNNPGLSLDKHPWTYLDHCITVLDIVQTHTWKVLKAIDLD